MNPNSPDIPTVSQDLADIKKLLTEINNRQKHQSFRGFFDGILRSIGSFLGTIVIVLAFYFVLQQINWLGLFNQWFEKNIKPSLTPKIELQIPGMDKPSNDTVL